MSAFQIDDLSVVYQTEEGSLPAVRHVSLALAPRETLGLVGESGSGKTTLALGAIGYLPANGRVMSGAVRLTTRICWRSRATTCGGCGARGSVW